jgi:hypothetical protein
MPATRMGLAPLASWWSRSRRCLCEDAHRCERAQGTVRDHGKTGEAPNLKHEHGLNLRFGDSLPPIGSRRWNWFLVGVRSGR